MEAIEVVAAGAFVTIQDRGRPGWAHLGVPRSGVAAPAAAALANRLVGNDAGAAVLEAVVGGVVLSFGAGRVVAVTGASCEVTLGGRPLATHQCHYVPAGGTLVVGPARVGLCAYVAVAGGIEGERVLGSLSSDTLSGLGPAPLVDGDVVAMGLPYGRPAWSDAVPVGRVSREIRLHPGPRLDWLTPAAVALLGQSEWTVGSASNRIGTRLEGVAVQRARVEELPSEGAVRGAVQVPPDGQPVVFGPDHPTTGGYPVVAVVDPRDLDAVAQVRPGERVRLVWARTQGIGSA